MDAEPSVPHLRPMRESDLDEIMRIELRAYPFPWTRGIFRDCMHAGYPMWVQERDGMIVGTPAQPKAEPRPVVKQMICAPPAAWPVADTGS